MQNVIDNILNEMFINEAEILNEANKNKTVSLTNKDVHDDIARQYIAKRDDAKAKWKISKASGDTKRANFWYKKYMYYENKRRQARDAEATASDNALTEMVSIDDVITNYIYSDNDKTLNENIDGSYFGIPRLNKYPLNTIDDVNRAIKYFNYVEPADEATLAKNIIESLHRLHLEYPILEESNRFDKYLMVNIDVLDENNHELIDKTFINRMPENKLTFSNTNNKVIFKGNKESLSNKIVKDAVFDGPTGALIKYLNGDKSDVDNINTEIADKISNDFDVKTYLRKINIELNKQNPDINEMHDLKRKIRQAYNQEISKDAK